LYCRAAENRPPGRLLYCHVRQAELAVWTYRNRSVTTAHRAGPEEIPARPCEMNAPDR
jgi:hypothetical protein